MPNAARNGDNIKQHGPHCHAAIHPPAPVPTPMAHPAQNMRIISQTSATVFINKQQAATLSSQTVPCAMGSCVPAGPGIIANGSLTVLIEGKPAARVGDMTAHSSCVAPIPSLIGSVQPPGSPNVFIGG